MSELDPEILAHQNLTLLDPNASAPGRPPFAASERVWFRGGWTCRCVAASLPLVEEEMLLRGLIRNNIDIFQLGWRSDVGASAGTHAKGGCTDVGQRSAAQIDVWRLWGWTMQDRGPWFPGNEHAHGWPWGCPHLAPGAQYQIADWRRRRNGLAGHGPVRGRWPIDTWTAARDKREKILMGLKEDIINGVWQTDDMLPNDGFTGNTANKGVSGQTALVQTNKHVLELAARVSAQDAKLDAILAAIAKVAGK